MTTVIFLILLMVLTFLKLIIHSIFLIHRLQQFGYSNLKLIKWLNSDQNREIFLWDIFELLIPLLVILILSETIKDLPIYKYFTATVMITVFVWKVAHPFIAGWIGPRAYIKVPLAFTFRVKRLLFTLTAVIILLLFFAFVFAATPFDKFTLSTKGFFRLNAFLLFISAINPVPLLIANIINIPIEKLVYYIYFSRARNKISKNKIIKVAITGSYGKTSTKFFLSTILNEKYKTLFTPASYNTPMGVSKILNQSDLKDYELFVVEMGADHKGDINTLCKLVKPDYGIITAIDIQHLETFITMENIIETKLSLFRNLDNGIGIYNHDSRILRENISRCEFRNRLYSYSMEEPDCSRVDIIARDIKHSREGLSFSAVFKNNEKIDLNVKILGRHNVSNLLACILMSKILGLTNEQIESGIVKIKPVEHRLQIINSSNDILVLDDSFNSNLNGAFEALKVLKEIEGNKKIIVTPGFIGLGEKEDEANFKFGNFIAEHADVVILIGRKKTEKIHDGIIGNNFKEANIKVAESLKEAQEILKVIVKNGDIILFENDLPDAYGE